MKVTSIDGVNVIVAQTIINDVGLDMSRWKPKRTSPRGWDMPGQLADVTRDHQRFLLAMPRRKWFQG